MREDNPANVARWSSWRTCCIFPWLAPSGFIGSVRVRTAAASLLLTLGIGAANADPPLRKPDPPSSSAPSQPAIPASAPKSDGATLSRPASPVPIVRHVVFEGENLYRISLRYGVTMEALGRANGLADIHQVQAGQILVIPGAQAPAHAVERDLPPPPQPRAKPGARRRKEPLGPDQAPLTLSLPMVPSSDPFSWPVDGGTIRSGFGLRQGRLHAGVDIAAPGGSDVRASRDGTVVYSGHRFQGYGNVVMIDHRDGFMTVYAHNSENLVIVGDRVFRGQTIARVGATGNATGAHCHFEIRRDELALDPDPYCATDSARASSPVLAGVARAPLPLARSKKDDARGSLH